MAAANALFAAFAQEAQRSNGRQFEKVELPEHTHPVGARRVENIVCILFARTTSQRGILAVPSYHATISSGAK